MSNKKPTQPLRITLTDTLNGDELLVGYSDESTAVYDVRQLAVLTPKRSVTAESLDDPEPLDL